MKEQEIERKSIIFLTFKNGQCIDGYSESEVQMNVSTVWYAYSYGHVTLHFRPGTV